MLFRAVFSAHWDSSVGPQGWPEDKGEGGGARPQVTGLSVLCEAQGHMDTVQIVLCTTLGGALHIQVRGDLWNCLVRIKNFQQSNGLRKVVLS